MCHPVVMDFIRERRNEPQIEIGDQRRDYGEGDEADAASVIPSEPCRECEQQAERDMTGYVYNCPSPGEGSLTIILSVYSGGSYLVDTDSWKQIWPLWVSVAPSSQADRILHS